jgi:divalent metal cation (Fe/Co/Zn/Cd) transporter
VSLWGCLREVNKVRAGRSLWHWVKETRQSELVVVLGEDVAALLGLALALLAVAVTMVTGNPVYDALGSVAIGAVLVGVAIGIGAKIKGLLIGESVEESLRRAIEGHIAGQEGVAEVLNLITLQLGDDVMVAVKARMKDFHSQTEMIHAINRAEAALKATYPQVRWIFFEPDIAA